MGGKNSSPNYTQAAIAQGEANEDVIRDQTYANKPTQYTPWGYTTWNPYEYTDPSSGEDVTRWEQTQGLTPELQEILNKQIAMQGGKTDIAGMLMNRMGGEFGSAIDWRGLSPMGSVPTQQYSIPEELQRNLDYSDIPGVGNPAALRKRAEQAVYNKGASRLGTRFDSSKQQLETKLRNQGLGPEDAAWKSQVDALGTQETDAYGQLQSDAVRAGLGEQQQLFGQNMGLRNMYTGERDRAAGFYNQAAGQAFGQAMGANNQNFGQAMQGSNYANQIRQQQITEAMTKRGFSLNEINALLSGQQVNAPQMPNFSQAQAAQPAPIYQGAVDQGNFNQAANQMGVDAFTGLASAGMGF